MDSTLLLNASYEPIKIIPWERAITLFFLGKVEVVDTYEHEVRSVSLAIKVPAVVRLLRYIHLGRRRPPLTRFNLLARDNFECQYCACSLSMADSTIDHIVPRSQGGTTCWHNIVVACHDCNRKKGGRTPAQAKMNLRKEPVIPEWLPVLTVRFHKRMPSAWLLFLAGKP
ncbi:MAG: HNH endonuclease [Bdellovibrionota bacterium]